MRIATEAVFVAMRRALSSGDCPPAPTALPVPSLFIASQDLRPEHTMRTKYAISDAFVRNYVFVHCPSVAQYVYSLSVEHFSDYAKTQSRTKASEIAHFVRIVELDLYF